MYKHLGPHAVDTVTIVSGESDTISYIEAPPTYGTMYRTFTSNSIATSTFGKKTAVPVTKKADKYQFSTSLAVPADSTVNGLAITFGAAVDTSYAFTVTGATSKTPNAKLEAWTVAFPTVVGPATVTVSGFSAKAQKVTAYNFTNGAARVGAVVKKGVVVTNQARLPLPNAVNAVEQAFADGAFTGGLLVGKNHATDGLKKKYG